MQNRYFIAITLPSRISKFISNVQDELLAEYMTNHNVMQPLVPHITLLHPNVLETLPPDHFLPKVKHSTDSIFPIQINFESIDSFEQRVMHIDVNSPHLYELQTKLVGLLPARVRAQYLVGRPYKAHITLAQVKPKQNLPAELIKNLTSKIEPILPCSFEATELVCFKWIRPRTYEVRKI